MKAQWLDRNLIRNPLYFTLCTSEEILKKECKRLKVNHNFGKVIGKDATANFMKNERGESVAIVCLYDHSHELEMIYALLVHEAVHIWQEICDLMGEINPSAEFEAYSIQQISQQLFYEYKRQRKGKRK